MLLPTIKDEPKRGPAEFAHMQFPFSSRSEYQNVVHNAKRRSFVFRCNTCVGSPASLPIIDLEVPPRWKFDQLVGWRHMAGLPPLSHHSVHSVQWKRSNKIFYIRKD